MVTGMWKVTAKKNCEYVDQPCYTGLKVCNEHPEWCKRRKLLAKGMSQEDIDTLWNVPEKYRVRGDNKE